MTQPLLEADDLNDVELLPQEREQIARLADIATDAVDEQTKTKVLLGAFVAYRLYASRVATANTLEEIFSAEQLSARLRLSWTLFSPYFVTMVAPLFTTEMIRGVKHALPIHTINALAVDYAQRTGGYFAHTSAEAVETGFNAMVNRKIIPKIAAERVLFAFGLTKRQMNAFVATSFDTEKVHNLKGTPRMLARRFVVRSVDQRLNSMSQNEAYVISQEVQQISWLWEVKRGSLPETAERTWVTAADEKVCKICGPMNGQTVPIREHFILPDGTKAWVAGVHPNCRCRVKLRRPESVFAKALQGAERNEFNALHPRGAGGLFATKTLQDIVRESEEKNAQISDAPLVARPVSLSDVKLSDTGLSDAGLSDRGLSDVTLSDVAAPLTQALSDTSTKTTISDVPMDKARIIDAPAYPITKISDLSQKELISDRIRRKKKLDADLDAALSDIGEIDTMNVGSTKYGTLTGDFTLGNYDMFDEPTRVEIRSEQYFNDAQNVHDDVRYKLREKRQKLIEKIFTENDIDYDPTVGNEDEDYSPEAEFLMMPSSFAGEEAWLHIDRQVVGQMLDAAAVNFRERDEDFEITDESPLIYIEVPVHDNQGKFKGMTSVPAKDIGEWVSISQADMRLDVYRFDTVFTDSTMESGSMYGDEGWQMNGIYSITKANQEDHMGYEIQYWELTPLEYYQSNDGTDFPETGE